MKIFFALAAMMLLAAAGALAETTNTLSKAEIEGRELARQLCEARPTENFTNTGIFKIRTNDGKRREISTIFRTVTSPTNWMTVYECTELDFNLAISNRLSISHFQDSKTQLYCQHIVKTGGISQPTTNFNPALSSQQLMVPFANSDFWLCDLGLEFFRWPAQKVLKHEMRRSRSSTVLESTNPNPATNGYSRVVAWIDHESGGIVQAEAYDFQNKLLKEFAPKSFKKVAGQWQLQEMEIRNVQTGSRTRLEFNLGAE